MSGDPRCLYSADGHELWLGDSLNQDHVAAIMGGRKADLLCLDGPFSAKTHDGHRAGKLTADRAATFGASAETPEARYSARKSAAGESGRNDLDYDSWSPDDVQRFVDLWHPLCAGWMVSITDDILGQVWREEMEKRDRFAFPGIPLVETGSRCRLGGDGPSPWTVWVMVARPRTREFASWGTLPGAYVQPAERDINSTGGSDRVVGGKPFKSMCRIVSDYSRRGQLVVDPTCAAGTTNWAAKATGRRSIGIDISEERLAIAIRRLRDSREQRSLFSEGAA